MNPLTFDPIAVGGADAADFTVVTQPTSPLEVNTWQEFEIKFDASSTEIRNATLFFTNNANQGAKSEYTFDLQGTSGVASLEFEYETIDIVLNSWDISTNLNIAATNRGEYDTTYTNEISYISGSDWLFVSPDESTLSGLSGEDVTLTFTNVLMMSPGIYSATMTATGNQYNGDQVITVNMDVKDIDIPNPQMARAGADGHELIRLSWTPYNYILTNVMVVAGGGGYVYPKKGATYTVGDMLGAGEIIYKGGPTNLERVVQAGSTYDYHFYTVFKDLKYSPGLTYIIEAPSYEPDMIQDEFCYTNGAAMYLDGLDGGYGWTNAWEEGIGTERFSVSKGSLAATYKKYNHANKIVVTPDGSGETCLALRQFDEITNGQVFVSYYMNYATSGADTFVGVSLMNGDTEEAFFGELPGEDALLGIRTSSEYPSTYSLQNGSGYDYLVVGMYDFDTDELKTLAYSKDDQVPESTPSTWEVTHSVGVELERFDGIRLSAGGSSGSPGDTYFDEIRISTNWQEVVNVSTTLQFAGYTWNIVNGEAGPGPNWWSSECAYLDTNGYLHLDIAKTNIEQYGTTVKDWVCGGLFSQQTMGYGSYIWYIEQKVDDLNPNAVAGLFTYEDDYHEVDIEFTEAFTDGAANFNYSVQPADPHQTFKEWRNQTEQTSTHGFTWNPGRVDFFSWNGQSLLPPADHDVFNIFSRTYISNDIPRSHGREKTWMNMWLFKGRNPVSGQTSTSELQLVIKDFIFIPSDHKKYVNRGAIPLDIRVDNVARYPTNQLLENPGFESGTATDITPWTRWGGAERYPACAELGTGGVQVVCEDTGSPWLNGFQQTVEAFPYDEYVFAIDAKAPDGSFVANAADMILAFDADNNYENGVLYETNYSGWDADLSMDWQRIMLTATSHPNAGYVHARVSLDDQGVFSTERAYFDNAFLGTERSSTNYMWHFMDNELGHPAGDPDFRMVFNVSSTNLGLSRGTTDSSTQMNVHVGSWLPDYDAASDLRNIANYSAEQSTPFLETTNEWATNTWYWSTLSGSDIEPLITNVHKVGSILGTNGYGEGVSEISASIYNTSPEAEIGREELFGYIKVEDDDPDDPIFVSNLLENASFETGAYPPLSDAATAAESWDYLYSAYTGNTKGGNDLATRQYWTPRSGRYSMTMHNFQDLESQRDSVIWQSVTHVSGAGFKLGGFCLVLPDEWVSWYSVDEYSIRWSFWHEQQREQFV